MKRRDRVNLTEELFINNFSKLLILRNRFAILRWLKLLFNSLCFTTVSHCVRYSSSTTTSTKITSCKARNVRKLVSLDSFPFSNRWSISVPFCCQHVHFKNTIDQTHVSPVQFQLILYSTGKLNFFYTLPVIGISQNRNFTCMTIERLSTLRAEVPCSCSQFSFFLIKVRNVCVPFQRLAAISIFCFSLQLLSGYSILVFIVCEVKFSLARPFCQCCWNTKRFSLICNNLRQSQLA